MGYQPDGSVLQIGMARYDVDHHHENINYPILGIVLNVYYSDDYRNNSAIPKANFKGTHCEARVLVLNDGKDAYWTIPNVVILPRGSSGVDNFYEELPRAATQQVDGTLIDKKGTETDYYKADGDFCVVGFIGGSIEQPFMLGWWPHPANDRDPGTGDLSDQGFIEQSRRLVRRFQGTTISITSQGSIFVDTCRANADVQFGVPSVEGNLTREKVEEGGDVDLTIKKERQLSVRFDPTVPQPTEEPDLLQPNPAKIPQDGEENKRTDDASKLLMNQASILHKAGRAVQMAGNNDGTGKEDTVFLGESPTDHLILGEKHQVTFNALVDVVNSLVSAFNSHTHLGAAPGTPTSPPTPGGISQASKMPDANLSTVVQTE